MTQTFRVFNILGYAELRKYFKKFPTDDFVLNKLLPCFEYTSFEDKTEINSNLLIPITEKIKSIIPELCNYIEDTSIKKAFIYNHITFYKIVVMLKNFLNCFGITIKRRKVNIYTTTKVYYSMVKIKDFEKYAEMELEEKECIDISPKKIIIKCGFTETLEEKFKIHNIKTLIKF